MLVNILMKFIWNRLLKIIDSFLDSKSLTSAEAKMRARMALVFFLFHFSLGMIILLGRPFLSGFEYIRAAYLFLICIICLALIKKGVSPDKLLPPYLANLCLTALLSVLRFGPANNLDVNSPFMFEMIVAIACLIIVDFRIRLSIVFLVIVSSSLCFWHYASSSKSLVTLSSGPIDGILFKIVVNMVFLAILLGMSLRIRRIAQIDVDQEIEWQIRNAKLGELTSTVKSMIQLFSGPMYNFQKNLQDLSPGSNESLETRVQQNIDELLVISQSFGWIFRAHRPETPSSMLSSTLLNHLGILLSPACQERGWILDTRHGGNPVHIWGPIPSIMLFLFTISAQMLERATVSENQSLYLELEAREGLIVLKLRWKNHDSQSALPDTTNGPLGV